MKKTYINPNIEVVKIATQQILAVSNGALSTAEGDKITSNDGFGAHEDDFDW